METYHPLNHVAWTVRTQSLGNPFQKCEIYLTHITRYSPTSSSFDVTGVQQPTGYLERGRGESSHSSLDLTPSSNVQQTNVQHCREVV